MCCHDYTWICRYQFIKQVPHWKVELMLGYSKLTDWLFKTQNLNVILFYYHIFFGLFTLKGVHLFYSNNRSKFCLSFRLCDHQGWGLNTPHWVFFIISWLFSWILQRWWNHEKTFSFPHGDTLSILVGTTHYNVNFTLTTSTCLSFEFQLSNLVRNILNIFLSYP
jgi:hypothetical protein